jgi:serine/threonine-protein kinase ATR
MKHKINFYPTAMVAIVLLVTLCAHATHAQSTRPRLKDLMGLCVHTVQFKPDLYKPICLHVRDYHGLNWDVGDNTSFRPLFPLARNQVNWETLYGDWTAKGYVIDASIMFGDQPFKDWKDPIRDAQAYGLAFARFFGPSHKNLVAAMEIGNEPGKYSDTEYRTIFEHMARGIRLGDPNMTIATCATDPVESERYAKGLTCIQGLEDLYDVINIHSYAQVEGWPTWKRSFPEDPQLDYLKKIKRTIAWRDTHAPDKRIWLTEFGWDCTTKPAPATGDFKDWIGSTDLQQAQYIVRSWLLFSAMGIERAYMFWFNDQDKPQVHGSSGLTRDYQPKPSFYAVSHLYATLGDFRFSGQATMDQALAYEYTQNNTTQKILAVWLPSGSDLTRTIRIPLAGQTVTRIEQMPLDEGPAPTVPINVQDDHLSLPCSESVTYIFMM